MLQLLVVFLHLLAVCTAIGAIVATDLRVLHKLATPGLRLAPPNGYVVRLVGAALAALYVTGALLVWLAVQNGEHPLANPKLQAKLVLVGLLTLNAALLHRHTFPWLTRARRVAHWRLTDGLRVAVPVAASNSLWLYCAFLGIARPWNQVVPLADVLAIGALVFLLSLASVLAALAFAARRGADARASAGPSARSSGRASAAGSARRSARPSAPSSAPSSASGVNPAPATAPAPARARATNAAAPAHAVRSGASLDHAGDSPPAHHPAPPRRLHAAPAQ